MNDDIPKFKPRSKLTINYFETDQDFFYKNRELILYLLAPFEAALEQDNENTIQ